MRGVKAQTRVLKSHFEERLERQLDWSEPLATWLVHSATCLSRYRIQADEDAGSAAHRKMLETSSCRVWRESSIPTGRGTARRTRDAEINGIFVGHHERIGASLFLSERGLLRGTRVQRKTADQQWDNEFIRKCRGVPWMLIGEEPEAACIKAYERQLSMGRHILHEHPVHQRWMDTFGARCDVSLAHDCDRRSR